MGTRVRSARRVPSGAKAASLPPRSDHRMPPELPEVNDWIAHLLRGWICRGREGYASPSVHRACRPWISARGLFGEAAFQTNGPEVRPAAGNEVVGGGHGGFTESLGACHPCQTNAVGSCGESRISTGGRGKRQHSRRGAVRWGIRTKRILGCSWPDVLFVSSMQRREKDAKLSGRRGAVTQR